MPKRLYHSKLKFPILYLLSLCQEVAMTDLVTVIQALCHNGDQLACKPLRVADFCCLGEPVSGWR